MIDDPDGGSQASTTEASRSPPEASRSPPEDGVTAGDEEQTAARDDASNGFSLDQLRRDGDTDDERSEIDVARTERQKVEEENERLRKQWATNVGQTRHDRISLGFALLGGGAGVLGYVLPGSREILFAIAAIGLASGLLIRYLNTERLIPARVSEELIEPLLTNEAAVASQLGLSDRRAYLPTEAGIRLVVPETHSYDPDALIDAIDDEHERFGTDRPFVFTDSPERSALSLRPSAESLLKSFIVQRDGDRPESPSRAIASLQEGVTDVLELADSVETDFDGLERVTYELDGVAFASKNRFDPPVVSFLGAGMAWALSTPVEVDVRSTDGETLVVAYEWDAETA